MEYKSVVNKQQIDQIMSLRPMVGELSRMQLEAHIRTILAMDTTWLDSMRNKHKLSTSMAWARAVAFWIMILRLPDDPDPYEYDPPEEYIPVPKHILN